VETVGAAERDDARAGTWQRVAEADAALVVLVEGLLVK